MSDQTSKQTSNKAPAKARKKLWQICTAYHCAIMGTCLTRADLKRIKQKRVFGFIPSDSDYVVHTTLSAYTGTKDAKSRFLHKYLDNKFRTSIKRYAHISEEDEILKQWKKDCEENNVSGPFWAIMTHPAPQKDLIARIYGECHMISFDTFAKLQKDNQMTLSLQQQVARLESKSDHLITSKKALAEKVKDLVKDKQQISIIKNKLERENIYLKTAHSQLLAEIGQNNLHAENSHLKEELTQTNEIITALKEETMNSQIELLKTIEEKAFFREAYLELKEDYDSLEYQNKELFEFLDAQQNKADPTHLDISCIDCSKYQTDECNGPDLCGKTILYVGGRSGMIDKYRDYVTGCGGNFLHHDGGKENSKQKLSTMLVGADAVVCPVDCVSHNACKCAKKVCKRFQKPFVTMRSSGLSTLAKGLESLSNN